MAYLHYRHNQLTVGVAAFRLNRVQHRVQLVRRQMADALRMSHVCRPGRFIQLTRLVVAVSFGKMKRSRLAVNNLRFLTLHLILSRCEF